MTRRRTRIIEQGCHQMLQMYEEECEIGTYDYRIFFVVIVD